MAIKQLEIITVENDSKYLHQKSKDIESSEIKTKDFQSFIDAMFDLMYKTVGIGLASPQCRFKGEQGNIQKISL
jgi:peptide deformylase